MAGALSAPGPGRLAAADAVVRADPTVTIGAATTPRAVDVVPAPRLPAAAVERVAAGPRRRARRRRRRLRRRAPATRRGRALHGAGVDRVQGHGWPSAALTPYALTRRARARRPARRRRRRAPRRPCRRRAADRHAGRRRRPTASPASRAARASRDRGQAALFFTAAGRGRAVRHAGPRQRGRRRRASGSRPRRAAPRLEQRLGAARRRARVEVLDRDHAADADAGDPSASDRETLVAIFGTMGGIAGAVALFVVAGTFALAIAQRRRETAVLRALGATPRQVRRLIAAEALIVLAVVASGLGLLAGGPLARAIVERARRPRRGAGRASSPATPGSRSSRRSAWASASPSSPWSPRRGAPGASARPRRCARWRSSTAVRAPCASLAGVLCLAGGAAMALLFSGEAAQRVRDPRGDPARRPASALLGRWLLGLPAALLAAAAAAARRAGPAREHRPGRQPLAHRGARDADRADRDARRHAGRAARQRPARHRARDRRAGHRGHVVAGRDGAPLPAGTAARLAGLPGVERRDRRAADRGVPARHGPGGLGRPVAGRRASTAAGAAGALDLGVARGRPRATCAATPSR